MTLQALFLTLYVFAQLGRIQLPQPVGYVNDFARVIPADRAARIESIVQDVRRKSGGEIVIVTLADLGGRDPSDIAREIGRPSRPPATGGRSRARCPTGRVRRGRRA